jgi:uncharacterized protein YqjF (DUF2071 family)
MQNIDKLLSQINHRPYPINEKEWAFYQQWNNLIFCHWQIDYDLIRQLVPSSLEIDCFENKAYISFVPFTMEKVRPKNLPNLSFVSDFHEINVRTYVKYKHKSGVYFLNIEASKILSTFLSRTISKMPYGFSRIKRTQQRYFSKNPIKRFSLDLEYEILDKIEHKSELDKWLTERYAAFIEYQNSLFIYDIHHFEWELNRVKIKSLNLDYKFKNIDLAKLSNPFFSLFQWY